jgi:hypothetical protein
MAERLAEALMSDLSEQSQPSSPWLRIIAVAAAIFGLATLYSAGAIVLDYGSSRELAGAFVPFVVWFNLAAGILYVVAAAGIWRRSTWAAGLSVFIALATALAAIPFALHVMGGGDYEMRTVGALAFRIGFWAVVALILFRTRSRG